MSLNIEVIKTKKMGDNKNMIKLPDKVSRT